LSSEHHAGRAVPQRCAQSGLRVRPNGSCATLRRCRLPHSAWLRRPRAGRT